MTEKKLIALIFCFVILLNPRFSDATLNVPMFFSLNQSTVYVSPGDTFSLVMNISKDYEELEILYPGGFVADWGAYFTSLYFSYDKNIIDLVSISPDTSGFGFNKTSGYDELYGTCVLYPLFYTLNFQVLKSGQTGLHIWGGGDGDLRFFDPQDPRAEFSDGWIDIWCALRADSFTDARIYVPETATFILLGIGIAGLARIDRFRKQS